MIAIDSSALLAFLKNEPVSAAGIVFSLLSERRGVFPPVVVSELLSDPFLDNALSRTILSIPTLEVTPGYWERVGVLRAKLIEKRRKARLADALIAQSCLDHEIPLITCDGDFRAIQSVSGLKLV